MIAKLRASFKTNPKFYYAMSIAATWAGAGSFIVGTQVAQTAGIFPWLLWALGNVLACIVFGIFALKFPKLRAVATSRPVQILMGLMCVFQIWLNMNGIYEMLSPTVIGSTASYIIVYGLSAFFIIFYLKRATFRKRSQWVWSGLFLAAPAKKSDTAIIFFAPDTRKRYCDENFHSSARAPNPGSCVF